MDAAVPAVLSLDSYKRRVLPTSVHLGTLSLAINGQLQNTRTISHNEFSIISLRRTFALVRGTVRMPMEAQPLHLMRRRHFMVI